MGKTAPSSRMALEFEIESWKSFREALTSQEDREAFDELMDMCRNNAMASSNACNPISLSQWSLTAYECRIC